MKHEEEVVRDVAEIFRSYSVLDVHGRHVNGTDKETNHHYGDAYEKLFPYRDAVQLMMEVGVADGSSLLAWSEVFPNALCVGLDIHPAARLAGDVERIEFHLGDATNRRDCERASAFRQFDAIIDDGSHRLEDAMRTLLYLWLYVRPGGVYVIEEFANVGALIWNIMSLFPQAKLVDTIGPFGGSEPLVVLRKPT